MDDQPLRQLWIRVREHLRTQVPDADFVNLVQQLRASEHGGTLVLEAPGWFAVETLSARYTALISKAMAEIAGRQVPVRLQASRTAQQQELFPGAPGGGRGRFHREGTRADGLISRYTFDQLIIGANNQFAHAAARAVANQPGERYNPLFIYGGVGLGKTHLVNAIGYAILDREPQTRVLYLSAESFMNELIAAIRKDRMDDFKNRFRRIDVLILDDVQFLAGRERTQEEFFHTFNSLYETHRQIVLTSDKFPKEIPDLEERLRNRFEWGLIADIQPPDLETRVAILEKKAEVEHLNLPHDVALFLAHQIDSNVRELEGALTRLGAFASLNGITLSVDFAREVLQSTLAIQQRKITIDRIQEAVCEFFDLRPHELHSKKRTKNVVLPRQVAMYLCRRYTQASYPIIGDRFGGRDHSTVIHAANTIARRLREDADFRTIVERIERLLQAG